MRRLLAAFGRDVRRLRPNIVIDGVDGTDEFGWPGAELHIGEVVIALDSRRGRCPMTTIDPDTLEVDRGVLKDIIARFDGKLALNADVLVPGTIRVGDPVELVRSTGPRAFSALPAATSRNRSRYPRRCCQLPTAPLTGHTNGFRQPDATNCESIFDPKPESPRRPSQRGTGLSSPYR